MARYFTDEQIEQQQHELAMARIQASSQDAQQDMMAMQLREGETNLVREQLSLDEELETIEYLLRGFILKRDQQDEHGTSKWVEPTDKSMVILTDHGVHLIMNTIMFYLNKNTLLSNYKEEIIDKKMEDFSNALSDALFMESDKVFTKPTNADAVEEYEKQLKIKVENEIAIAKIQGITVAFEEARKKILERIDVTKAIFSIKEQMKKDKLKRFELLVREVQDSVHSTYLRAWNGQERRTLREHIHISEATGGSSFRQEQKMKKSPLSFFRK